MSVTLVTGPPNEPVLFCLLASVVVVCNAAAGHVGGRAAGQRVRGQLGGRHYMAGQYGYIPLGRHLVFTVLQLVRFVRDTCCLSLRYISTRTFLNGNQFMLEMNASGWSLITLPYWPTHICLHSPVVSANKLVLCMKHLIIPVLLCLSSSYLTMLY